MSLLMEALKKAEEAKRLANEPPTSGVSTAAPGELSLTPLNDAPPQHTHPVRGRHCPTSRYTLIRSTLILPPYQQNRRANNAPPRPRQKSPRKDSGNSVKEPRHATCFRQNNPRNPEPRSG